MQKKGETKRWRKRNGGREGGREKTAASPFHGGPGGWKCRCSPSRRRLSPSVVLPRLRQRIRNNLWWRLLSIHHTCRFLRCIYPRDTFATSFKLSRVLARSLTNAYRSIQIFVSAWKIIACQVFRVSCSERLWIYGVWRQESPSRSYSNNEFLDNWAISKIG